MKKVTLAILGITALVISGIFLFSYLGKSKESGLDDFAKCLSSKGVIMYGTYWCPHCKNEKNAFGSSFEFINYVECTEKPNECLAKGVDGYPTWIFPDGRKLVGEQGIARIQEASGCSL